MDPILCHVWSKFEASLTLRKYDAADQEFDNHILAQDLGHEQKAG